MQESQKNMFSIDLNQISFTVEAFWCNKPHTCILSIQYSIWFTVETFLCDEPLMWLVFRHLQTNFFQTWHDDIDH